MAEKQSSFDSPLSRRTKKTKKKEQNSAIYASPKIRDRKLIFAKQESAAETYDGAHDGGVERVRGRKKSKSATFPRKVPPNAGAPQPRPSLASIDWSYLLHSPKNVQALLELLQRSEINPNRRNETLDAPLHSIVKSNHKDKVDMVITLFTHSEADVNLKADDEMTALHFAVQRGDVLCAKALIAYGANVNQMNCRYLTALDIATMGWAAQERRKTVSNVATNVEAVGNSKTLDVGDNCKRYRYSRHDSTSSWIYVDYELQVNGNGKEKSNGLFEESDQSRASNEDPRGLGESTMIRLSDSIGENCEVRSKFLENDSISTDQMLRLLYSVGAVHGMSRRKSSTNKPIAIHEETIESELERSIRLTDYDEGKTILSLSEELEDYINMKMESSMSLTGNPDEAIAIAMQQKEIAQYRKTQPRRDDSRMGVHIQGGSKVLFLDGGGVKGLVQIEILCQIEERTGKKITELFDWIVGTSTGGILALGLVYAKKTLQELRQIYFRVKEEIYARPRAGFAYNTKALESLLQEALGTELCMNSIEHPKVLIAAVNKRSTQPQLHFFNNCFSDEFSKQPIWKVARYTSAAPMFFKEFENYVDGGVLANNPCEYGLTAIQSYYRARREQHAIALVVSVGTGVYPAKELGKIDAHEFLYFGKHWFSLKDTLRKRTTNLVSLLSNALVESEMVADNCSSRCMEQGIPFFRFSPHLDEVIAAGETDNEKLVNMIIQARSQTAAQGLKDFVRIVQVVDEANMKMIYKSKKIMASRPQPSKC